MRFEELRDNSRITITLSNSNRVNESGVFEIRESQRLTPLKNPYCSLSKYMEQISVVPVGKVLRLCILQKQMPKQHDQLL